MAEQTLRETGTFGTSAQRSMRWVIPAALLCLALSLAAGGSWLLQTATLQVLPLPGGGTLRFVGTTYGTEHAFVDGPRWQQLALPLVGAMQAQSWRWSVKTCSSRQPALVCWISSSLLPATAFSPHYLLLARVENENGSMASVDVWKDRFAIEPASFFPVILTSYPRRGNWIYLNFHRVGKLLKDPLAYVGRIVIPNPTPGALPQWKPQPLPQAARAGAMSFFLKRFRVGVELPQEFSPWEGQAVSATALQFTAWTPGSQDQEWEPLGVRFSNAAGDLWPECTWNVGSAPGEFHMPASLGRDEDAWKMEVRFGQTRGFPTEEAWVFRDLPLPPSGEGKNLNRLVKRDGQQVWLRSFIVWPLEKGKKRLVCYFQLSPCRKDNLLTVTDLRDQQGRILSIRQPFSLRNGLTLPVNTSGASFFSLEVPSGMRRADLSVVLHRSRSATFLAAPEQASLKPAAAVAIR